MIASFIPRRVRRAVGGTTVVLALGGLAAACGGTNDNVVQVLALVGSDTTQDVMGAISNEYEANNPAGYNPDPDNLENVLAIANPDNGHTVPGDAVTTCGSKTYKTPPGAGQVARPNGSSAGRAALQASVTAGDGCIDIARSSSAPSGTDPESFEYYAYALDAVGVTTASTLAPADNDITLAEVRAIYHCQITDWSQLGGAAGPIERYWPQTGSGTRNFAQSDILGFDPTSAAVVTECGGVAPTPSQENTGAQINANGDNQRAIFVYSVANWVAMSRNTITDERFGQEFFDLDDTGEATLGFESPVRQVGGVFEPRTPTASDPNGPVAEANVKLNDSTPAYPGVRYVFNIIDNSSGPNSYTPAKRFVGFDNVAQPTIKSPLCDGAKANTLLNYGFGPLSKTADPTHNVPGTACRLW